MADRGPRLRLNMVQLRGARGLALSASPIAAAGLSAAAIGIIWWLLALRIATPDEAGQYLAVLGIATLSAEFANLGAGYVLIRFLPTVGPALTRTALVVVTCSTAFVLLVGGVLLTIAARAAEPQLMIALVLSALAFAHAWYTLTDDLLLALGRRRWILVRTTATALFRVGLLILAAQSPRVTWWMLGAAYATPSLAAVLATVVWLRRDLFATAGRQALLTLPEVRGLVPYGIRSYSANLAGAVGPNALPPLLSWQLGPAIAAQFGVMWLIASILMLVPSAISATNLAGAARGEQAAHGMVSRGLALVVAVQVPAILAALLFAPLVLPLLDPAYSAIGVMLLAPLLAGVLCLSLTSQLYSRARLTDRGVRVVAAGQWLQAIVVLTLSLVLMPNLMLMGVSISWMIGAGLTLAFVARRTMRLERLETLERPFAE